MNVTDHTDTWLIAGEAWASSRFRRSANNPHWAHIACMMLIALEACGDA